MATSKKLRRRDKNREARRKGKRFQKKPPLYWVDKLIYIVLIALPILLMAVQILSFARANEDCFAQSTLLAVSRPHQDVATAGSILLFVASALFAVGLEQRQPIFGIPGFVYGRAGGMKAEDLPLLSKGANFSKYLYGFLCALACLVMVVSCLMVRYARNDRWELHNQEIVHFDSRDRQEETLLWTDIRGYSISTHATGGKHSHYELRVTLTTREGESLSMHISSFRDFETFLQTDARLVRQGCNREAYIDDWIWRKLVWRQEFTPEQFQILSQLLGIEAVGEDH